MATVEGLEEALAAFNEKIQQAAKDGDVSVTVGYSEPYGIYVHEDMEAHHPNGQAKFLEQPARTNKALYGRLVARALKDGQTVRQALMAAATALKQDSQALVPVDTGALKKSAFVRVDVGAAAKVARAQSKARASAKIDKKFRGLPRGSK